MIAALRDFAWTAVKITGHSYEPEASLSRQGSEYCGPTVREETDAGQETDTARYLAAGARRALLVTRCGLEMPIEEIRAALGEDRNVIFESNRIMMRRESGRICLALREWIAGSRRKPSFVRLLSKANALGELRNDGIGTGRTAGRHSTL